MFGDYFGQRADYSTGLFYSGHRKYLIEDGSSSLDTPNQFKTRKSARNLRLAEKEASSPSIPASLKMMTYYSPNDENSVNGSSNSHRRFRHVANIVVGAIALEPVGHEHHEREDWIQKSEAGVKFWVNTKTGDVSTENPFPAVLEGEDSNSTTDTVSGRGFSIPTSRIFNMHKQHQSTSNLNCLSNSSPTRTIRSKSFNDVRSPITPIDMGTAYLLYDREPVEELFQLLDSRRAVKN